MKKNTILRMVGYLTKYRGLLIGSFIGALLFVPLALLGPVFIGRAIDAIVGKDNVDFNTALINIVLLLAVMLASCILQWLMLVCTRKLSAYAAQEMRRQAFDRLQDVPLSRIDMQAHGDIVSRLVNDVDAVGEGLLQGLTQFFPSIVTIVATVALMLYLDVRIALVVILVTPLSVIFAKVITGRTSGLFKKQMNTQGDSSGYIGEMVANQEVVRAFGYEEESEKEYSALNKSFADAYYKATFYSSVVNPGTRLVNAIVYAAAGIFGAIIAISGGISIGGISAFLAYANQYTKPFNEISAVFTQLQAAVAGAERVFTIIDWPVQTPDKTDAVTLQNCEGDVEAKDVFFSYTPTTKLIQNFNMHAAKGQRIALVGPTGCGKTTLINLLMRFYEVDSGIISVDGTPIDNIKRNALRSLYGMVLQETWLQKASVRDNIAYAKPGASIEEVTEAAKAAYAHHFIMRLPQGYDTILDTGGGNLSAGQKQLLCIARIMLAKPDMLILDEATSSIDTRTELLIQKALEKLMAGHTSFIVAHRLSTIQNADIILVMRDGKIIESGNHAHLLAQNGFYANLYNSQFNVK